MMIDRVRLAFLRSRVRVAERAVGRPWTPAASRRIDRLFVALRTYKTASGTLTMIKTTDLSLAVFLTARGHPLLRTESNGQYRVYFVIEAPRLRSAPTTAPMIRSPQSVFEQWRAL
jgi:hypothetical protein